MLRIATVIGTARTAAATTPPTTTQFVRFASCCSPQRRLHSTILTGDTRPLLVRTSPALFGLPSASIGGPFHSSYRRSGNTSTQPSTIATITKPSKTPPAPRERTASSTQPDSADGHLPPPVIAARTESDFRRLLRLAEPERWTIGASVACLVVSSSVTMSVPYCIGKILDIIFTQEVVAERLTSFCAAMLGVFVVGAAANFGRIYLMNGASLRIIQTVRERLYRTMINQEAGWFDTRGTGELINRLSTDTYIIGNSLSQNLSDGMRSAITIVAGTTAMFYTSPELSVVSLCIVPCIAPLAIVYGRYVKAITRQVLDQYAVVMKTAEERLNNIKTVKMFCREEFENRRLSEQLAEALRLGYKDVLARALFYGTAGLAGNAIIVSVLYYGGTLVATNDLTVGALTSFLLYAGLTSISLTGVGNFYTEINKGVGAAARVWEIYDRPHAIPVAGGVRPERSPRGAIRFDNVRFAFPSRPANPILDGLSLELEAGQTTAIVGRSGSGKTTLATMLMRLYDPQAGAVWLDGRDLRELDPQWLRRHIGAVNQEPVLFSGTIRENILYGLNEGDVVCERTFERVVRDAFVDEFVRQLPRGYETMVGQRGMMLSGGQKQRVAIARALIRNPSILILDEATSALDAHSEAHMQAAIENASFGRTVLTIAHRLSTIRSAGKIAVLDQGRVGEYGTYEELLAKRDGMFRELVERQTFAAPLVPGQSPPPTTPPPTVASIVQAS